MIVGFHTDRLDLLTRTWALLDYAHFTEHLLGHSSRVIVPREGPHHPEVIELAGDRFPLDLYGDLDELERVVTEHRVDLLFCLKSGRNDGVISSHCRTVVQAYDAVHEPHGDLYIYASSWLSAHFEHQHPYVPYIMNLPATAGKLRDHHGIPSDALVLGRYGEYDHFDIPFVHEVITDVAARREDLYFLFLNTAPFCAPHPRIIHLEGTVLPPERARFIASCDGMIHGRASGETCAVEVVEFSSRNRAVITYSAGPHTYHAELLGERAIYYSSAPQLMTILSNLHPFALSAREWNIGNEELLPVPAMRRFNEIVLS